MMCRRLQRQQGLNLRFCGDGLAVSEVCRAGDLLFDCPRFDCATGLSRRRRRRVMWRMQRESKGE